MEKPGTNDEATRDSKVELQSFVAFRELKTPGNFEFYPKPREIIKSAGKPVIVLGDVPLPGTIVAPPDGLTALYGFKDALDEMARQYGIAREKGMNVVKLAFRVSTGRPQSGTLSRDDIPFTQLLNTRRLHKDLAEGILEKVRELQSAESKKPKYFLRLLDAGTRPDLLTRAVRSMAIYKNITTIVYSVPDGTPRGRQVATTFTDQFEMLGMRPDLPFVIQMPSFAKARKAA